MSQHDFTPINPASYSGTDLSNDLNSWVPAVVSSHSGASRPSYASTGTVWHDTAGGLKFYNGSTDDLILKGAITSFGVSLAEAADATAGRAILGSVIGTDVQAFSADTPSSIVPQAEAEAGTSTTARTWTAERVAQAIQAIGAAGVFTSEYESPAQTITAAGLLTLAHGLGEEPKIIEMFLQCTSAQHNYSVGDRVVVQHNGSTASGTRYTGIYTDSTNVYVRFSNSSEAFSIVNKTSGVMQQITNSSWDLYIKAYA